MTNRETTSWQKVSSWYGKAVGKDGSYYHQHIILPNSLKLLGLSKDSSLLDLACGQGVLARAIPEEVRYVGVDVAPALIKQAGQLDKNSRHIYVQADASQSLPIEKKDFTHAAVILSLQNMRAPEAVVHNARLHLQQGGKLLIVINHPCFRIPRQTSWEIDEGNKIQYRRIDRYLTPLEVPIDAHPGRGERSEHTWSYHFPLSYFSEILATQNFVILKLEEWVSDKQSVGQAARMENRARKEIPMFMGILARKD